MKKLDKLLVTSFIPPFIMTFFIALFVLIMQFLWKYIDDIVGKGLDVSIILELLFYRSTALVPMALPIAVLISSVMVMGNLGERYELASIKSSGIPLLRVMRPLIVIAFCISFLSYLSSDYLIPYSNLKFKSRLYDIRKQKPTFNLAEGSFNDDFGGTIIRIGEKNEDGSELKDILIYDHSGNRGNDKQINAKKGEMYSTTDKGYLVMRLFDGHQYEEIKPASRDKNDNYEHLHIKFKEWEKVFDMSEFDMNETNQDLFKNHQSMLNTWQLIDAIDSLERRKIKRQKDVFKSVKAYFYPLRRTDSIQQEVALAISRDTTPRELVADFINTIPPEKRGQLVGSALTRARNVKNYAQNAMNDTPKIDKSITAHEIELHRKFSLAYACIMFLFIGAPMGAIVRKGGFGWPILIAIIFFVFFIMFNIMGEKSAKIMVITAFQGMWMPCMVLTPVGLFLTWKAMNDSKVLNMDTYTAFVTRIFNRLVGLGK